MNNEKIYNEPLMQLIDRPAEITAFLKEIDVVCQKHRFSISHEDTIADFLIEPYSKENQNKLFEAILNCEIPGAKI